jgi:hypothetical protein
MVYLFSFSCRLGKQVISAPLLGNKLPTSLELLLIELGMSFQLFQVSYILFGNMVTTSWLKWV